MTTKFKAKDLPWHYNQCIKSFISVFGARFGSTTIMRGKRKIIVPIEYGNRQKFVRQLNANQNSSVNATFPRMIFELTGFTPNNDKADNESNTFKCIYKGGVKYVNSPIWWDIDISLFVISKNVDDGLQILEQIIPNFRPNETWKVRFLEDFNNLIDSVPVTLTSGTLTDDWQGDMDERRYVTWNISFRASIPVYDKVSDSATGGQDVIYDAIALTNDHILRSIVDEEDGTITDTINEKEI